MDHPDDPETEYGFLAEALPDANAEAFVHVADRFDDDLRYLTRFSGPDRPYAFAYHDGDALLFPPSLFDEQAEREFPGATVVGYGDRSEPDPVDAVLAVLGDRDVDGPVAVPPAIRHDAYVRLSKAGYEVVTTSAVESARERKTEPEQRCLESVERAAQRGLARAEAVLAEATVDGDVTRWNGDVLTTEVLRREINAELSRQGVDPSGYSVIGAGPTCADLHFTGTDEIRPGESVLIDLSPRGPHGYYGDVTRTFTVGSPDPWVETAYDAVLDAREAAMSVLDSGAGVRAAAVHEAASDVLSDAGYGVGDVSTGFYHGVGHGIGVSLHEGPGLTDERELRPGHVVTVEPGVYDPDRGGVRLEDLVVVTRDGFENLVDYPLSLTPRAVDSS